MRKPAFSSFETQFFMKSQIMKKYKHLYCCGLFLAGKSGKSTRFTNFLQYFSELSSSFEWHWRISQPKELFLVFPSVNQHNEHLSATKPREFLWRMINRRNPSRKLNECSLVVFMHLFSKFCLIYNQKSVENSTVIHQPTQSRISLFLSSSQASSTQS